MKLVIYGNLLISSKIMNVLDPLFRKDLEWYIKSIQSEEEIFFNKDIQTERNLERLYGKEIVNTDNRKTNTTELYLKPYTVKFGEFIDIASNILYKL